MNENDLAQVVDRPNMDRAQALIDAEIERVEEAERKRMFAAIRQETVDPQTALQSWMRLEALDAVRSRLVKREKQAQAASKRVEPDM